MLNSAFVPENDAHKLLWDFDIQTDPQISNVPADNRIKLTESEKKDKYLDLC